MTADFRHIKRPTMSRTSVRSTRISKRGGRMLDWSRLLSKRRISVSSDLATPGIVDECTEKHRSDHYRDGDRILFSSAFRRMHDKTQVFSKPGNDHVHSRLTHSIEVASIGRSIGQTIGEALREREPDAFTNNPQLAIDIANIIYAACLAHDIGNPPFGHAGEDAIAKYFVSFFERNPLIASQFSKREKVDLTKFEGNAQGFRLLSKRQNIAIGGLQLTAATLAAFCKYPRESGDDIKNGTLGNVATKKHGCFQDDKIFLDVVATEVGLTKLPLPRQIVSTCVYTRHPLSYLVEAADNISYTILDLEDAIRLEYVNESEALKLIQQIASKAEHYDIKKSTDIVYLRGRAIQRLRSEVTDLFLEDDVYQQIMNGTYHHELIKKIPSQQELNNIIDYTIENCYEHKFVAEMKIGGFNIISGLLDEIVPAVMAHPTERSERQNMVLKRTGIEIQEAETTYQRILKATDYVAGTSDSFAADLYRRFKGIEVSSSIR